MYNLYMKRVVNKSLNQLPTVGDNRRWRRRGHSALDLRVDWLALSQVRRLEAAERNGRHRKRNSGHTC